MIRSEDIRIVEREMLRCISELVMKERKRRGITRYQLAKEAEVSFSVVVAAEKAKPIYTNNLAKILAVVGRFDVVDKLEMIF